MTDGRRIDFKRRGSDIRLGLRHADARAIHIGGHGPQQGHADGVKLCAGGQADLQSSQENQQTRIFANNALVFIGFNSLR